jgi:hypothetical protein
MEQMLQHFLAVEVVDLLQVHQHSKDAAAGEEVDLQLLDGQDCQLLKHQQWKHYTSQVVVVEAVETITALEAVLVVLFTMQHFR